jgi:hypothetical protein
MQILKNGGGINSKKEKAFALLQKQLENPLLSLTYPIFI